MKTIEYIYEGQVFNSVVELDIVENYKHFRFSYGNKLFTITSGFDDSDKGKITWTQIKKHSESVLPEELVTAVGNGIVSAGVYNFGDNRQKNDEPAS